MLHRWLSVGLWVKEHVRGLVMLLHLHVHAHGIDWRFTDGSFHVLESRLMGEVMGRERLLLVEAERIGVLEGLLVDGLWHVLCVRLEAGEWMSRMQCAGGGWKRVRCFETHRKARRV